MNKRFEKERQDLIDNPIEGVKVEFSCKDNTVRWFIDIEGPKDSLYYGGIFKFVFTFPENYPFKEPNIEFKTNILHIYLSKDNNCECCCLQLQTSGKNWVPSARVRDILIELKSLFFYDRFLHRDILNFEDYKLQSSNKQLYQQKINEVMAEEKLKEYKKDNILTLIAQRKYLYNLLQTNPYQIFIDLFY